MTNRKLFFFYNSMNLRLFTSRLLRYVRRTVLSYVQNAPGILVRYLRKNKKDFSVPMRPFQASCLAPFEPAFSCSVDPVKFVCGEPFLKTIMHNQVPDNIDCRFQYSGFDIFIRLMCLLNIARSHYYGFQPHGFVIRRFRAEGNGP